MRNDAYWNNRMRILEESLLDMGYEYVTNLERQYDIAIRDIEGQIATWYQRFAKDNAISLAEAKRLLSGNELKEFRWTVEEYIKHGEQNAISQSWLKQLKNASAKVHISRLDSLKIQLQQQAELLYGNQLDGIDKLASKIYSEGYYHTAFEVQKGIGVGWSMHALTDGAIRKVLSKPWTLDGQTFSDRIWNNKRGLVNTVNTQLTQMLMRGTAPDKAIKTISERFRVSKSQAGRLVMTESAAFSNIARKDCFTDLGVDEFIVVETLDNETCSLCGELDGKVFPMSEYAVGVTAPPFHPWCRGTTAPHFADLDGLIERAARGTDGKTYYVPGNMNYKEWKKRFIDGGNNADLKEVISSGKIKLTDDEQMAINRYISSESYSLNEKLRNGKLLTEYEQEWVKNLDAALEKMPEYRGMVYRSLDSSRIMDLDAFWREHSLGKTVFYPAYTSASTRIYDETMDIQLIIHGKHARDATAYNPGENEILFKRNSKYRVVKVEANMIYMEEE